MIEYIDNLTMLLQKTTIRTNKAELITIEKAMNCLLSKLKKCKLFGQKVFVIGNGGSAAIAAHTVNDLLRNCAVPAFCLSEAAVLTCLSNDLGYEEVYAYQIQSLMLSTDVLIALSSSGQSENILRAVHVAKEKGCYILTLSGFDEENALCGLGDLNIYVPATHYGYVELIHQILLHCLTDLLKNERISNHECYR